MNLKEIADLQVKVGKHRLQMSAAENFAMSIYGDFYLGGKPMISVMVAPTELGRTVVNKFGESLHPDVVTKTHDSYFKFGGKDTFDPETYQYGSLTKEFEAGNPDVYETLMVVAASNDEVQITQNVPYSREKPGQVQFDLKVPGLEKDLSLATISGRVSDEIVEMLNGKLDLGFVERLMYAGSLIPEIMVHIYDGEPWNSIPKEPEFEDRWTRTKSGYINVPKGPRFDELLGLMDVTETDGYRLHLLQERRKQAGV